MRGARVIFEGTGINISMQGQRHLGAALGSREYLEEYVFSKVEDWVSQVVKLEEFACHNHKRATQPLHLFCFVLFFLFFFFFLINKNTTYLQYGYTIYLHYTTLI